MWKWFMQDKDEKSKCKGKGRIGLEEYGCKKMENKSFGQNRMASFMRKTKAKLKRLYC